ncbi:serine hydrolase [Leptolyngbya sp. BL0902]|uniref:serine hydrolase n=1 Tax=Leptolyngbya sp. BL0902 TaxID=1115757 RepID=UPI0018E7C3C8|nr:serine hydrolase [Leptolyngbya sp. BL0902]QQE65781.1 serine hydrolase [Leptolyngbya sp. BL0902]
MAQHDDFSTSPSRPSSPSETGASTAPGWSGARGVGRSPDAPAGEDWRYRPSPTARRRNQWRQYKHMTPDFGPSTPDLDTPDPLASPLVSSPAPSSAKAAALPSFNLKGSAAQGASAPAPAQSSLRPAGLQGSVTPPPQRPLAQHSVAPTSRAATPNPVAPSRHPHSTPQGQPGTTPFPPRPGSVPTAGSAPTNVTPLRSAKNARRRTTGIATGVAAAAAATTAGLAALAAPPRPEGGARQQRFSPQRRLAKLPQPALYAIRLAILGIGVAAIAGTLLSVFSPSNVASNRSDLTTTATANRRSGGAALPGQGAVSIAAIQPSTELTRLKAQLDQLATLTPGLTPGVYAFDIDSGRYVDLNGTQAVAAASTIKVPILVAFLQQVDAGNLALNQAVVLQDRHVAGGSGTLANDAIGSEYTALDIATRMIVHSDNTATNMMIEALGGLEAVNQQFTTWGLESTALRNPLPDLEGTNTTSTRDLALLMALVDQGDLLSRRSRERLFSIMQRTVNRSLIAFSLTDGSLVANKTGDIALALGDVALVDTPNGNRYALAIMVQRPNNDGRASELIRRITDTVHRELNQPIAPVGRPASSSTESGAEGSPASSEVNPAGSLGDGEGSMEGGMEAVPSDLTPSQPAPSRGGRPGTTPSGDQIPPG